MEAVMNADTEKGEQDLHLAEGDKKRIDLYGSARNVSVLTILFSDIVGFSTLSESMPESVTLELLNSFESKCRVSVEAQSGMVLKFIGDEVLAIFDNPTSAVVAALNLHDEMRNVICEGIPIQLRTGIHMGQVAIKKDATNMDIFGRHVNRTARVKSAALPGELLVTDPIEDNVRAWFASQESQRDRARFIHRRTHHLKGIGDPITVYTVQRISSDNTPVDGSSERLPNLYLKLRVKGNSNEIMINPEINRRFIIGSNNDCGIVVREREVSNIHAMILLKSTGQWIVADTFSENGTLLNGIKVKQAPLKTGDRITIGSTIIEVTKVRDAHSTHAEATNQTSANNQTPTDAPKSTCRQQKDRVRDLITYTQPLPRSTRRDLRPEGEADTPDRDTT
jgi:class 3 adenylate cyclase/pSer/pThr/pTyr-binding forkhead associated (FHA) protein